MKMLNDLFVLTKRGAAQYQKITGKKGEVTIYNIQELNGVVTGELKNGQSVTYNGEFHTWEPRSVN